jgi:antitoxin CptB|tara:strand:+ start:229 stop:495 length:267 start_codon:yes stop_codon:yes gene_type:complete
MIFNIDELKKKIIYRSTYRGTKEMDALISSFTKQIINDLNGDELINLSNLLDIDDENLYKFNQGLSPTVDIEENKVSKLFKEFKYNKE